MRLLNPALSLLPLLAFYVPTAALGEATAVHAILELDRPDQGPYPSDQFTVADPNQRTGRRVNLPLPDCSVQVSDCQDVEILNQLDGFNVQPRVSVPFDGAIDVASVTSRSVFLLRLGPPEPGWTYLVGINQIVWDPANLTLHFQSEEMLDQHTRYALIVTNDIRDAGGARVEAGPDLRTVQNGGGGPYGRELRRALAEARRFGIPPSTVVAVSVFTTQSVTAALEQIHDQLRLMSMPTADFRLLPDGTRATFPVSQLARYAFNQHTSVEPPGFTPLPSNITGICDGCGADLLGLLRLVPGGVGTLAFGKYSSPDFEVHPGEYLPEVPTASGSRKPTGVNEVYFNLFLPEGSKPAIGWPVAIFGHGSGTNKNVQPFAVAGVLAQHGIATICINIAGNGLGPLGTLTLTKADGTSVAIPAGGRSIDQNGDNRIVEGEGRGAAPPRGILGSRDGQRQTVVDLMQLVRVIQHGVDVDGDQVPDLDPRRIYYFGHSLGGHYGTMFLAVEPAVRAGVLNAPGTPTSELRLTPMFRSGSIGALLASRIPTLLNAPGLTNLDGVPVGSPQFNENLPLRDTPPVSNNVDGAMAIQKTLDVLAWVAQPSSAAAWAPYLNRSPLPGVPQKAVILQFGKGDQLSPNPVTNAIVRAGNLASRTVLYRNDLAFSANPAVPKNPHFVMTSIAFAAVSDVARGLLDQIAQFFESDGTRMIQPQPQHLFDMPVGLPLSESLSYIP